MEDADGEKAKASLKIYDPYYCTGAVVRHMAKLGFSDVYNRCEDFYAVDAAGRTPAFDVLVTNPAYSGNHIPRLLDFLQREAVCKDRAFALLMPSYVCAKDYWAQFIERHPQLREAMAFLCPRKRYVYWTPAGLRSKKQAHSSALGNRTSPFVTFWYLHFGRHHKSVLEWWRVQEERQGKSATAKENRRGKKHAEPAQVTSAVLPDCVLVQSVRALPKGVRPATPAPEKRKRPRPGGIQVAQSAEGNHERKRKDRKRQKTEEGAEQTHGGGNDTRAASQKEEGSRHIKFE